MKHEYQIRLAESTDLNALIKLENTCFETDRLSKRSFMRFIKPGAHDLLVLAIAGELVGYVLILYRAGTNLARLYSIAIKPDHQGKGLAKVLLDKAEHAVSEKHCVYLRLEVSVDNTTARRLYEKYGYRVIDCISNYYDDGADALRMEKHMQLVPHQTQENKPFYQQTTDFTCGPASLMMAMKTLSPDYEMSRQEELQIWREATTIYMTAGHGGCSPHGLALSAWRRGFDVTLHINQADAPFLDGVRSEEKKSVIRLVHEDFLRQISGTNIRIKIRQLDMPELDKLLDSQLPMLALISTWRLNRNKAPHWVYVADSDDSFVYINDPDIDDDPHLTQTDATLVPISKSIFHEMARFGQKRLRCLLVISGPRNSVKK